MKTVNGLVFEGSTMLVHCRGGFESAPADEDFSETGKFLRGESTICHQLGDIQAAIWRQQLLLNPNPTNVVVPFDPGNEDNLVPLTGTWVKRAGTQAKWRSALEGELGSVNPNSIYLPTYDDWSIALSVRVEGDPMSTDDLLTLLDNTGLSGIGITLDGVTTGTFTVDSSEIEVIES